MVQKIIITGFPHCGTTILKSIIGHINSVKEIYEETDIINLEETDKMMLEKSDKKFIVCKYPLYNSKFLSEEYNDYIKIIIIRNPLYVFSSLNKRFDKDYHNIDKYPTIEKYIDYIKVFKKLKSNIKENVYTIKYEDMFKDNFLQLKNIFDNIGMKYNNCIFDNTQYINYCDKNKTRIKEENIKGEKGKLHMDYRIMQINKPFLLNNDIFKINLHKDQETKIINNNDIIELYPDILKII